MGLKFRPLRLGQCRSLDLDEGSVFQDSVRYWSSKARVERWAGQVQQRPVTDLTAGMEESAAGSRPLHPSLRSRLDSLTL